MESINCVIQRYVDGWKRGDESEILDTLEDNCIIIESHGPTYRGKKIVKEWIEDWHTQGNKIEKWNITSFHSTDDLTVFEWIFAYKNKNAREVFEGISLVKFKNNKISALREYRATQFPFMWGFKKTQ